MHIRPQILIIAPVLMLGGCFGLATPDIQEPYQISYDQLGKENAILAQVKCELQQGILATIAEYKKQGPGYGYNANWLYRWAAKINLKISAQEKGSLNPNFGYADPLGIFSAAGGVFGSADATRTEIIGLTWSVKEILSLPFKLPCNHIGTTQIDSDLKIPEFILKKAFLAHVPGNIEKEKLNSPYDVFSYEATFISSYGGNFTPTWKFKRVSVNPSPRLLDISRLRTDDITITMGPAEKDEFGGYRLGPDAEDVRRASLFGQAVRTQLFISP